MSDSDYATLLAAADRRLKDLSAYNFMPQPEGHAPQWLTTAEGQQYLEALQRGDTDAALTIWDAAYGRALDAWINILWLAPWPATKEEAQ